MRLFDTTAEEVAKNIQRKILKPKMGTWTVHSDTDPRWNQSGRAKGFAHNGGPKEMGAHIEKCKGSFGEMPRDLERSFWKD